MTEKEKIEGKGARRETLPQGEETREEGTKRVSRKKTKVGKEDLATLEKKLKAKEAEATDYLHTLKRLKADFENFKKRMVKEQTQFLEMASQNIIMQLLPILDNLERALEASRENKNPDNLLKGVEMIHSQLKGILEKEGLKIIDPLGEKFDPLRHEALMQVESDEHNEDTVVEVLLKGYLLKEKLLRPAAVKVSKRPPIDDSQ
ncbi:MAG: nucleotide exchange factor GrpE [Actinomycetota bacterium]|nr:nucleotide exchange factor GrpE [Actinomycetota bacterium]